MTHLNCKRSFPFNSFNGRKNSSLYLQKSRKKFAKINIMQQEPARRQCHTLSPTLSCIKGLQNGRICPSITDRILTFLRHHLSSLPIQLQNILTIPYSGYLGKYLGQLPKIVLRKYCYDDTTRFSTMHCGAIFETFVC